MSVQIEVSVIIPVYNAEKFLKSAILSIIRQKANWVELILVNDGSKDRSLSICREYENELVQVISIENSGAGHARNVGIDAARGRWILFLDSDDLILPDTFSSKMLAWLQYKEQQNVEIIYGGKIECDMKMREKPLVTEPENLNKIQNYIPAIEFWSCIYRSDFLKENNIRFFEYQKQDIETAFRFRAFSRANAVLVVPELFFCVHRNNPTSNVNTWKMDDMLEVKAKVYYELFCEFNNREVKVSAWLYTEYIYYLKELMLRKIKLGFGKGGRKQLYSTLTISNKMRANIPWIHIRMVYVLLTLLIDIVKLPPVWKIFCFVFGKKRRDIIPQLPIQDLEVDDVNEIMIRLEQYKMAMSAIRSKMFK